MSRYTIELRYVCEHDIGLKESVGYNNVEDVIRQATPKIFQDFPIFDEAYRQLLCEKIIAHYYTQEIAYETVGLWKFKLATKMREIMPYYNQLYKSSLLEFNPLYDADYWEEHAGEFDGNKNDLANNQRDETSKTNTDATTKTDNTTTDNGSSLNKMLDTPQGNIDLLLDSSYLTSANTSDAENTNVLDGNIKYDSTDDKKSTIKDNNNLQSTVRNFDEYANHVYGKRGSTSYSKLLMEFRETFLNIDMMVIKELESLFMALW